MKELGKAVITTTDIISFPKGTIVDIGELECGEETAIGEDAQGGELVAYIMDWRGNCHDVDVSEEDFVYISEPKTEAPTCGTCGSADTYTTTAYHCRRCATTTEI